MPREQAEAGVYVFGGIAITSLVTASGAALAASLAFAGQQHSVREPTLTWLTWGVCVLGGALILALTTALFAYLNQLAVAFGKERIWLRTTAILLGSICIVAIAAGGVLVVLAARGVLQARPDPPISPAAAPALVWPGHLIQ